MTYNYTSDSNNKIQTEVEKALIERLFTADRSYPWLPNAPEADNYFADLDAELDYLCEELSATELSQQWHSLSAKIEASWLEETLQKQFAERMPQTLLQTIAQRVHDLVESARPLEEQLAQCVQSILPQWDLDDLQIMARPMAFAMRSQESEAKMEVALRSVRFAAWTELSGVEKAQLSLAIARYALAQLDAPTAPAGA